MDKHTLIGTTKYFTKPTIHISKEEGEIDSLCGKTLGFDYDIIRDDWYNDTYPMKYLTTEEVLLVSNLCKRCRAALIKKK